MRDGKLGGGSIGRLSDITHNLGARTSGGELIRGQNDSILSIRVVAVEDKVAGFEIDTVPLNVAILWEGCVGRNSGNG